MLKRLFISGIPASGKSFLAKRIASEVNGICVPIDDIREELAKNEKFKNWVNFYINQDESTYYTTTNYDEQWKNLFNQSEGMWPGILEYIKKYENESRFVIFEGVNILPHLAKKDFSFGGVILLGKSFEENFERNKKEPRWGDTEELQKLESQAFFYGERSHYKEEAKKYGYPTFDDSEEAYNYLLNLLK